MKFKLFFLIIMMGYLLNAFSANKQIIPFWNGILVACTTEEQVIKLIGEGYLTTKEDMKMRYYLNRNYNITIGICFDENDVVAYIEFLKGNLIANKNKDFLKKITLMTIGDTIRIGRDITFSFKMDQKHIISELGEPDQIVEYGDSVRVGYQYYDDFYLRVISGAEFSYYDNVLKSVNLFFVDLYENLKKNSLKLR